MRLYAERCVKCEGYTSSSVTLR